MLKIEIEIYFEGKVAGILMPVMLKMSIIKMKGLLLTQKYKAFQ